jgi:two-component system, OmpR family, phosphate regulon sensor histidine kinase PhoR
MKLRPLVYACLLIPLLASWMGASLNLQLLLLCSIAIVLETNVLRPLKSIVVRTRRLNVYPGTQSVFEVAALDRAVHQLEVNFDQRLQQAEREKQQVRDLLSSLPDPVLHFSADHHLLYLNPAAEVALELHRKDLIGRSLAASWTDILKPPQQAEPAPIMAIFEKPGKALLQRVQQTLKEGNDTLKIGPERTYRSLIIPLETLEQEEVVLLRDITDLKRLEEVRQLFLSSISHELRTPLTIIKGFAVTLLDHPDVPKDFLKPLQRMDKESDRLTRLVNDLLDLSQIQSQRLSLELAHFDAVDVLDETLAMLTPLAERQNIKLQIHTPEILRQHTLYADRDRLKQVIINLVDNAIKFTPAGGTVSVEATAHETWWELVIEDTGPGVPQEELPSLFEHFFRGKHNRKITGSGLGLAIVKEIVELHQGEVTAESLPGSGLRVRVRLPRHLT